MIQLYLLVSHSTRCAFHESLVPSSRGHLQVQELEEAVALRERKWDSLAED